MVLHRFEVVEQNTDLDEAIDLIRAALRSTVDVSAAKFRDNLATALLNRHRRTSREADLIEAGDLWRTVAGTTSAAPNVRVRAARSWGRLAADRGDAPSAHTAFATAVGLLPEVVWRGLRRTSQEENLTRWAGIPADAAAWAIEAGRPEQAVEVLEQGRSVLWSQLLQNRADLTPLRSVAPGLCAEMEQLVSELNRLDDEPPAGRPASEEVDALIDRRMRTAVRLDEVLREVRSLPEYSGFLAPRPFGELRQAAQDGPVIIVNISAYRCDAVIVAMDDGVRVVPLPGVTYNDCAAKTNEFLAKLHHASPASENLNRSLTAVLEWLWDAIAEPVFDALGYTGPPSAGPLPRLWWCPTGPLTVLPLHAAGRVGRSSVHDRVVSSYTTTLTALVRARTHPRPARQPRLLAIGLPNTNTEGLPGLPAVEIEMDIITGLVGASTKLVDAKATRQAVLAHLPEHEWVHLACHGVQNMNDPSRGAVHLYDGPLTVLRIAAERMDHAELAFLSACQTATTGVDLPDEAIHLAAAFQLAGYRHVIATLWPVLDTVTRVAVGHVYEALVHDGVPHSADSAAALHTAVNRLRRKYPATPAAWAQYVHIGP